MIMYMVSLIPLQLGGVQFRFCEITIMIFKFLKSNGCHYQPGSNIKAFSAGVSAIQTHVLQSIVYIHTKDMSYLPLVWVDMRQFTYNCFYQTPIKECFQSLNPDYQYFVWLLITLWIFYCWIKNRKLFHWTMES
jgi:hypothetical protein